MKLQIKVSDNIQLQLTALHHAEGLLQAVNENREHLSAFLPWVPNMQTVEDFENYIRNCQALIEEKKELSFVIFYNDAIIGRIGLHYMNLRDKNASIGYWLTKSAEGKGIIIQSCKAIIDCGFNELGLHRIEIKAATTNQRSRAIPLKLGFTEEGILRQAELVKGEFLDIVLFSMLKNEWNKTTR